MKLPQIKLWERICFFSGLNGCLLAETWGTPSSENNAKISSIMLSQNGQNISCRFIYTLNCQEKKVIAKKQFWILCLSFPYSMTSRCCARPPIAFLQMALVSRHLTSVDSATLTYCWCLSFKMTSFGTVTFPNCIQKDGAGVKSLLTSTLGRLFERYFNN